MKKSAKIFILAVGIPLLLFISISLKRKSDINNLWQRANIEEIEKYENKQKIIHLSKDNKKSLNRLKKKIIDSKNKDYLDFLKRYENKIINLEEEKPFIDNKYIKKENIQKKKNLDKRHDKMISDKKYLKTLEKDINDPKVKLEDIKIKDDIGEKKLKKKKDELKKDLNNKIKAYKNIENSIKNSNNIKKLTSIKTDKLKPYQKENVEKQIKEKIEFIRKENKRKEEQKKKEKKKRQEKKSEEKTEEIEEDYENADNVKIIKMETLEPFTVSINNKTYPIITGDQSVIDQRYKAWVLSKTNISGFVEKYDGDGRGLWLEAHRDIGEVIEDVDEIIYTDPNGVSKYYERIGYTRQMPAGEIIREYEDSDIYDLMRADIGEYIVFNTCIDDSQNAIAQGHIFQKK